MRHLLEPGHPIPTLGALFLLTVLIYGSGCSTQTASVSTPPSPPAGTSTDSAAPSAADRFVQAVFNIDAPTWFGLALFAALLLGATGAIAGLLALSKCQQFLQSKNAAIGKSQRGPIVWHIRLIAMLAVISGIVLLIIDSPFAAHLRIPISRAIAEAVPLVLVGTACLAWLAVDRPTAIDLIKQVLLAVAFILWGINLLMPTGEWSRFVGAIVIAIYVFDLAWLMEGNLRKRIAVHLNDGLNGSTSPDHHSAGVCDCDMSHVQRPETLNRDRRRETPLAALKK